jgi:hypothetical protein
LHRNLRDNDHLRSWLPVASMLIFLGTNCARELPPQNTTDPFRFASCQSKQPVMRYPVLVALGLLVVTTVFMSNVLGDVQHSSWTDAASFQGSESRYGKDFAIVQMSLSRSFQFADYNTTDTEMLFSAETNRQTRVAVICFALV